MTSFNLIALGIGAIGLIWLVHRLGWHDTEQAIVAIGPWFAVIGAIDLASVLCDAFAIHGFLRSSPGTRVSYARVLGAQASGLAINRLTPGNSLGEPVKVTMLVRYVPTELAVSAIVMFNLATIYVGIAAIAIGVPATALLLDLPDRVAVAVWIATAVLIALALALALIVRRGALATLVDAAAALSLISRARAERWRGRILEIDARVREVAGVRRGLVGVIGSRILNWAGTIVLLHAAAIAMTTPLVIAMLSVGILVTWMSNVIPLGLGLADGTNYALYGLLGASPAAGLVFAMVNRLRTVVLAMIGLVIMAIANVAYRSGAQQERVAGALPQRGADPP